MLVQTFRRLRAEGEGIAAVRFERVYDYTPEALWAAITEPGQIQGWLGEAELDLREGPPRLARRTPLAGCLRLPAAS